MTAQATKGYVMLIKGWSLEAKKHAVVKHPPTKLGRYHDLARPSPRVVWMANDPEASADNQSTAIGARAVPRRGLKVGKN